MLANIPNYKQFSVVEKLRLLDEIWSDIASSGEPLPLQESEKAEALRRDQEVEIDPSIALTLEEVWRRVDATRG